MRKGVATVVFLTFLGLLSRGARAATASCAARGRPWLELAANVELPYSTGKSSTVLSIDDAGCRLRSDIGFDHSSHTPGSARIGSTQLTAADLLRLRAEFNTARIGFSSDCRFEIGDGVVGFFRITWHGRNGRINTFLAVDEVSLPLCSVAIGEII